VENAKTIAKIPAIVAKNRTLVIYQYLLKFVTRI